MTFLDDLKHENNKTLTTNGENAYKSTNNDILDLSTYIGNSLYKEEHDILEKVVKSFDEDKLLATKLVFHARDVRHGGGDKKLGRLGMLKVLNEITIEKIPLFVKLVSEYGSYKDIIYIINDSFEYYKVRAICLELESILQYHDKIQQPTLLAKYMPTETTKDFKMKNAYRIFMSHVDITPKEYRKRNTRLRKLLNLVETNLTEKNYDNIDYEKVPSQASFKYREAFMRNDPNNYYDFLDNVEKGKAKINTGTLAPYQIVENVLSDSFEPYSKEQKNKTLINLWDNLKRPDTKGLNVLPIVDVSGSMYGTPICVAISLGILLAESIEGDFKNHFITFSREPEIQKVIKGDIFDKVGNMSRKNWDANTDLEKTFNLILDTAIKNDTPQSEMPKAIIIFSDMQFDRATSNRRRNLNPVDKTFYDKMKNNYNLYGYDLPFVVFWNIGYSDSLPVVENEYNTMLLSGFSQNMFDVVFNLDFDELEQYTPYKALLDVLKNNRYEAIEGLYRPVE